MKTSRADLETLAHRDAKSCIGKFFDPLDNAQPCNFSGSLRSSTSL